MYFEVEMVVHICSSYQGKLMSTQVNMFTGFWIEEKNMVGIFKMCWLLRRVAPMIIAVCGAKIDYNKDFLSGLTVLYQKDCLTHPNSACPNDGVMGYCIALRFLLHKLFVYITISDLLH